MSTNSTSPYIERLLNVAGKRIGYSWNCPGCGDCGPRLKGKLDALRSMEEHRLSTKHNGLLMGRVMAAHLAANALIPTKENDNG